MNKLKIIQIMQFQGKDSIDLLGLGNDGVTYLYHEDEWEEFAPNIETKKEQVG